MPVLTKRLVDAAAPREMEYQVYDGEIPGLALRVNPNSRKVYTLFYRTLSGRKRTLTLGVHGAITPDQARRLAKDRLAEEASEPAAAILAIRLLLLTGCRKSEILGLRWEDVDQAAGSFDGWPNYLWLQKGTYDIVFYKEGFKTLARQSTIYPGLVITLVDRLEPGPSVRPDIG